MSIHPTSIIDPSAKIAKDVQIGPFCTIGEDVQIERLLATQSLKALQ
jgi:UDP-N-acetylglucosamine acyltransferase